MLALLAFKLVRSSSYLRGYMVWMIILTIAYLINSILFAWSTVQYVERENGSLTKWFRISLVFASVFEVVAPSFFVLAACGILSIRETGRKWADLIFMRRLLCNLIYIPIFIVESLFFKAYTVESNKRMENASTDLVDVLFIVVAAIMCAQSWLNVLVSVRNPR